MIAPPCSWIKARAATHIGSVGGRPAGLCVWAGGVMVWVLMCYSGRRSN